MGDPCGIGPELWIRILCQRHSSRSADARDREEPELTIYGDLGVFERAAERLGLTAEWHRACAAPDVAVIAVTALTAEDSDPGRPNVASGAAQVAYLEAAIAAAVRGELDGICTAPIHKAWAKTAGLAFPGHTELLGAHLRAAPREVMMLAGPSLRVALATTHIALRDVARVLTVPDLTNTLVTTMRSLHRDFAIPAPRLWVAGLNPHAGEDGHFGDEEGRLIKPAMASARSALSDIPAAQIEGPFPPDSLFRAAVSGPAAQRPDAIVAMYHDQGLIPLKLLDFDLAVNVTLGLRIVRTSPDHGVAYDIAGRGLASPSSQAAALDLCVSLCARRVSSDIVLRE
jgi:4-hydroxythreonine-4-phosphate dehydrogenase